MLWVSVILERMFAQVVQTSTLREAVTYQFCCGVREEYLPTMSSVQQSSNTIQGLTSVIPLAQFGDAGVQGHTHSQRADLVVP